MDKTWEDVYARGHNELAPWDEVVTFVYRNLNGRNPKDLHVCEVGFGTGPNLEFLHNQGFRVYGIELSPTGTAKALEKVPLPERLKTGDFHDLPFETGIFDMVIDRGSLWYTTKESLHVALDEVRRVLRKGGLFFWTPCFETPDARFGGPNILTEDDVIEYLGDDFELVAWESVDIGNVLEKNTKVRYHRVTARKV